MMKHALFMLMLICSMSVQLFAQAATPAPDPQPLIDKGLAYLKSQQTPSGGWHADNQPPAITALVLRGFVQNPQEDDESMKKACDYLLSFQKPDGGFYKDTNANYNTAIVVSLLAATKNPDFQPQLDRGVAFLKKLQWN